MLELQTVLDALEACTSEKDIQAFHAEYLWKKWHIAWLYKNMKDLSPDEKKEHAKQIQVLSAAVNEAFDAKQSTIKNALWNEKLWKDLVDLSILESSTERGHLTLLSQARRRVEDIFRSLGYVIETGHHVVTVEENFGTRKSM